jgi:peroxiredoxin Q/BCP
MIQTHTQAPDFSLPDQDGIIHTLSQYRGKKVLLYFYPKDSTPGCTTEACNFRDGYKDLTKRGLVILGVSKDDSKSHKKFATKYELPFPLLADTEGILCQAYGVWGLKKFMGREYMGIKRASFLINEQGVIEKVYEEVKVKEHASDVARDVTV